MARKLPRGEETLPIAVVGTIRKRFVTPSELGERVKRLSLKPAPKKLLIERVRKRIAQGREPAIYRMNYALTPEEQLTHMEARDELGLELIKAEQELLEEEIRMLRE